MHPPGLYPCKMPAGSWSREVILDPSPLLSAGEMEPAVLASPIWETPAHWSGSSKGPWRPGRDMRGGSESGDCLSLVKRKLKGHLVNIYKYLMERSKTDRQGFSVLPCERTLRNEIDGISFKHQEKSLYCGFSFPGDLLRPSWAMCWAACSCKLGSWTKWSRGCCQPQWFCGSSCHHGAACNDNNTFKTSSLRIQARQQPYIHFSESFSPPGKWILIVYVAIHT